MKYKHRKPVISVLIYLYFQPVKLEFYMCFQGNCRDSTPKIKDSTVRQIKWGESHLWTKYSVNSGELHLSLSPGLNTKGNYNFRTVNIHSTLDTNSKSRLPSPVNF